VDVSGRWGGMDLKVPFLTTVRGARGGDERTGKCKAQQESVCLPKVKTKRV